MKESLSYDVLTVMQEKKWKGLTADGRKWEFSKQYYDYRWVHKRLCDLVANWCAMRAWATDDWLLLYQVSEKWLGIKSFDDYKKAVYKPRTPKPKKTREESNCKKESKEWYRDILWYWHDSNWKIVPWVNKNDQYKDMRIWYKALAIWWPHMMAESTPWKGGEESAVKKECKMIGTEDISSLERWENGGNMGIWWDDSNHSPRSPPVWYTAWTQITTTHRNGEWKIAIWYYPSGRVTQTWMIPTLRDWKTPLFAERKEEANQPRYKRLRSAFTGK